jgi:chromosome segregation ATPase
LSYSFNFEEYIDESEISSSTIPFQGILTDLTKNRLRDMLPMLEREITNLVQDADPIRRIFLSIKDNLAPSLAEALTPMSNIEDQAPKVKKAQRNLIDREALMAKKNCNKQEAKELAQLIDNLKDSSFEIKLELKQLRARRAELEQELENVKADIERHESNLIQIPDAIK